MFQAAFPFETTYFLNFKTDESCQTREKCCACFEKYKWY